MFYVCPQCGMGAEEKEIDPEGPFAICPFCHYHHPFVQQPLFIITGVSGAGKSTLCLKLPAMLGDCVVLETDILWGLLPNPEAEKYSHYYNQWLRIANNIGQSGRPVVLCGTTLPEHIEPCPQRRYFSTVYYLALVCEDAMLIERLKARPAWRGSGTDTFLDEMVTFNRWLKAHAHETTPPISLYDTSHRNVDTTLEDVICWIRQRL